MSKIKICGITNLEDAFASTNFGADSLGFNFYPKSKRYIKPEDAFEIIKKIPKEVKKVGVFVNSNLDEVLKISNFLGLDSIQLHGDETQTFVKKLRKQTGTEIIKAFRVETRFEPTVTKKFDVDAVLLDGFHPKEFGGTGRKFNWDIANEVKRIFPKIYLAGGITPQNIKEALKTVFPYFIDICSGVEIKPGKKDPEKLKEVIFQVKKIKK